MLIQPANLIDLPAILELQKIAYQSEAKLLNNYNIAPLTQTLSELEEEFNKGIILKAINSRNQLVGSVRGYKKDHTLYIAKLMVSPNLQNLGIGTLLLLTIEKHYPNARYELFTSDKSEKNLSLYIKNGYREFKRESIVENITYVYLEK